MDKKALVIVGSTASGKSDIAVRLAKRFGGEVISADSRQVYKWLDIGTGKITPEEMQGVPHHMLDVADPVDKFSAGEYREVAEKILRQIGERGKLPIIAGGTGFYIDALTCGTNFPDIPPNYELREKLGKFGKEELFEMLEKKDPARASTVDRHNKLRLVRALEIAETLGSVPALDQCPPPYHFVYIGLMPENLDKRIRERLEERMPGMLEEAKQLLEDKKITLERMRELGLEYKYLAMYLEEELPVEEMEEKLYVAIRQYARRQMTWFKRNKNIKWFTPEEYEEIEKFVEKTLGGR